jgi:hypothetical protein
MCLFDARSKSAPARLAAYSRAAGYLPPGGTDQEPWAGGATARNRQGDQRIAECRSARLNRTKINTRPGCVAGLACHDPALRSAVWSKRSVRTFAIWRSRRRFAVRSRSGTRCRTERRSEADREAREISSKEFRTMRQGRSRRSERSKPRCVG